MRRTPIKPSRGTTWPVVELSRIVARDGRGCVGPAVGMPDPCYGEVTTDHVRASGGMGMKSASVASNGVRLCLSHHELKTLNGRQWRPVLLDWIAEGDA